MTFANGVEDYFVLRRYGPDDITDPAHDAIGCHYIGRLKKEDSSRVEVRGCLDKPGDTLKIRMNSENSNYDFFEIDYNGNTKIL